MEHAMSSDSLASGTLAATDMEDEAKSTKEDLMGSWREKVALIGMSKQSSGGSRKKSSDDLNSAAAELTKVQAERRKRLAKTAEMLARREREMKQQLQESQEAERQKQEADEAFFTRWLQDAEEDLRAVKEECLQEQALAARHQADRDRAELAACEAQAAKESALQDMRKLHHDERSRMRNENDQLRTELNQLRERTDAAWQRKVTDLSGEITTMRSQLEFERERTEEARNEAFRVEVRLQQTLAEERTRRIADLAAAKAEAERKASEALARQSQAERDRAELAHCEAQSAKEIALQDLRKMHQDELRRMRAEHDGLRAELCQERERTDGAWHRKLTDASGECLALRSQLEFERERTEEARQEAYRVEVQLQQALAEERSRRIADLAAARADAERRTGEATSECRELEEACSSRFRQAECEIVALQAEQVQARARQREAEEVWSARLRLAEAQLREAEQRAREAERRARQADEDLRREAAEAERQKVALHAAENQAEKHGAALKATEKQVEKQAAALQAAAVQAETQGAALQAAQAQADALQAARRQMVALQAAEQQAVSLLAAERQLGAAKAAERQAPATAKMMDRVSEETRKNAPAEDLRRTSRELSDTLALHSSEQAWAFDQQREELWQTVYHERELNKQLAQELRKMKARFEELNIEVQTERDAQATDAEKFLREKLEAMEQQLWVTRQELWRERDSTMKAHAEGERAVLRTIESFWQAQRDIKAQR